MLATDAYAYLDTDNLVTAWAVYRGALICAQDGFASLWVAGTLKKQNFSRLKTELTMEAVRQAEFPHCVSRLQGMFCFPDHASALRAREWDTSRQSLFIDEYLAELSLGPSTRPRQKYDSNWFTYAPSDGHESDAKDWMRHYWSGLPYPGRDPIWEMVIDCTITVLGTKIRDKAYATIKLESPRSLAWLEIGRLANLVGSNLCNITGWLTVDGPICRLAYLMDMREAEAPDFLAKVKTLLQSDAPRNIVDLEREFSKGGFGHVPDLRSSGFEIDLSSISSLPSAG